MVVADNLSPQKAALLLTLALTKILNPDEIPRMLTSINILRRHDTLS